MIAVVVTVVATAHVLFVDKVRAVNSADSSHQDMIGDIQLQGLKPGQWV
jgi:hypothetical protein